MMRRHHFQSNLPLALGAILALSACGSGDDDTDIDPRDGGVARDSGFVVRDAGFRDGGIRDAGPRRDAGHYCALGNEVQVDGEGVPVDPATATPENGFGSPGALSCIDDVIPAQPQGFEYCLFECLDVMGATLEDADYEALEVAVFEAFDDDGNAVDPTYDRVTGLDREPEARLDVGYNFRPVEGQVCESGWAIEIGFSDLGPRPLFGERHYDLRVTSSSTSDAWVDTYYPSFIRRNASSEVAGAICQLSRVERTTPNSTIDFAMGTRAVIGAAAAGAGLTIPGSDDFDDGRGSAYALIEVRDCSGSDGRALSNTTAGFLPVPLADYYPGDDEDLARRDRFTDQRGRYLAVGFAGMTATSSLATDVRFGVGVTRDETCTEEFGGGVVPVVPDSLTVIRANAETVLHGE